MAESNQNISIIVDLVDKATAPLIKLREQIADLGLAADTTSGTPITPQAEGVANVTTQLEAATVAAATTSETIASINAEPIQAVAMASEAAAIALAQADAAEEGMRQEAAAMLGDLEAVAAQTNQIAVNTQAAAAAMGEGGGPAPTGGGASKGGVTSGIRGAASEIRAFSRLMLLATAAVKGVEIGWDAVGAGVAAAKGDTEEFDRLIQSLDKDIKGIPFVGNVASELGARINNALNLPEISFKDGIIQFQQYNEGIDDYVKHTDEAAKNQDKLTAGIKNLNTAKRENQQIDSQIKSIEQDAASIAASNNSNDFEAARIRLENLQRERELRLQLSKLGTEEGTKANEALARAENVQFGKQQAVKLAQEQDTTEQQLNDDLTRARDLLDQGAISQDQYNARVAEATTLYQKLTDTISDNARTLAGKSYTQFGVKGGQGFGLTQEELNRMNDRLRQAAERAKADLNPYGVAIRQNLQQPLESFVASTILNFHSVRQAFGTLLNDLASQLANFVASKVVTQFLNTFSNNTSGYGGLIGKIGGFVGAVFGGGAGAADAGAGFAGSGGGFSAGGLVPGSGRGDSVHARLTPGERVMNLSASRTFGPMLDALNAGDYHAAASALLFGSPRTSGRVQHFAAGGIVQPGGVGTDEDRIRIAAFPANDETLAMLLENGKAAMFDFHAKYSRQLNAARGT